MNQLSKYQNVKTKLVLIKLKNDIKKTTKNTYSSDLSNAGFNESHLYRQVKVKNIEKLVDNQVVQRC